MHYSRRNFLNKLAGALTFLGMPLYGLKDSIAKPSKLNIGIIASITGPMAGLGQEALRAAQMAVREINSQGGIRGIKTHLYIMDDAGRIDMAYQAFNNLAHKKDPVALIGASYIRYDKILSDLAERYKVPFFVINPFRKTWHRKELKYTFRIVPEVSLMAKQALSYIKKIADEKGAPIKKIGIFRVKSAAWEEAMEQINVSSKREKLSVTFDFTVPHNINGIRSIVHKSKNIPADIIILLMGGGFHMKTIVETMREIRYRTKAIVGFFSKLADTTYVAEHGNLFINLMDANYWADTKRR
ncbi:MAG: ABC transporter substrate-binding protein, partial [Desulfobacula sp.]|nr:ABC transporter substrate-binding protein [Desulfobacula sp.]